MVANGVRHVEPPLRLTRRGRAVVLALLVLLASLASAVLFTTASRAGNPAASRAEKPAASPAEKPAASRAADSAASQAGKLPSMVVQPGDTLWGIATRRMPHRDGREAMAELRRLNRLDGYGVDAGDVLVLPPAR